MNLTKIPTEDLYREINRRRSGMRKMRKGGAKPSCTCGECRKCKAREYMRARREKENKR